MSKQPTKRLLLTQDNTTYKHKRQTSMPLTGIKPAIPETKLPHTYTLDHAATRIGLIYNSIQQINSHVS
jgi:hypothetical protein